jgi:hypothetical protein
MEGNSKASRRGQAALFATLTMVPVLGMIGLVVDAGYAQYEREAAQTAAQAAAIGGIMAAKSASNYTCSSGVTCQSATACPSTLNTPTNPIQAACLYAQQNGFTNGGKSGNQTVMVAANTTSPPISGTSPSYWISVTVSQKLPLTFLSVLGQKWGNVSANSTTAIYGSSTGGCVYVMSPSGSGITMSGGGISSNCGVYVNSNSSSAVLSSGGSITTSGTAVTDIVGGWTHAGGTISPAPVLGSSTQTDPFASMTAPTAGSCNAGVSLASGTQTISQGTYCGAISIAGGTLTLNEGLYYLEGGLSISGGAIQSSGTGVTFYVEGGSIDMSGGTITLNAPTTGTYQGILIFQSRTNSAGLTLSGGSQTYSGAVYAIDSTLSISGGTYTNTTFVANTISISGGTTTTVNGAANTPYTSASVGFIQ